MRAVVQRVSEAEVTVEGKVVGRIGAGICVLVGVTHVDGEPQARRLAAKIHGLRIFDDADGTMNLSLGDVGGGALVVSQFTLYGDARKGRRPSYGQAAGPDQAEPLVDLVAAELRGLGTHVETGRFRSHMVVTLANDGPVTIIVDV